MKITFIFSLVVFLTLASAGFVNDVPKSKAKVTEPVKSEAKIIAVQKVKPKPTAKISDRTIASLKATRVVIAKLVTVKPKPAIPKRRIASINFSEMELAMANNLHKPVTPDELAHAARINRHKKYDFDDSIPDE